MFGVGVASGIDAGYRSENKRIPIDSATVLLQQTSSHQTKQNINHQL